MRSWQNILMAAITIGAITASYTPPAFAAGKSQGFGNQCQGNSCGVLGGSNNKGAPGPIAGAGLPFLLVAGGYALVRRYRNRSKAE
jgi:hypothetical protein